MSLIKNHYCDEINNIQEQEQQDYDYQYEQWDNERRKRNLNNLKRNIAKTTYESNLKAIFKLSSFEQRINAGVNITKKYNNKINNLNQ